MEILAGLLVGLPGFVVELFGWRKAVAALALLVAGHAGAQVLALTFDDGLNPDTQPQARAWNAQLLANLRETRVVSMVFPALVRTGDGAGRDLIANWSAGGHDVGNHTSRHRSLGSARVPLDAFVQDVMEADAAFRTLPTWQPRIRFPYLKEGETAAKRDGFRTWMKANGYAPAPVSIDTSDWYYDQSYRALAGAGDEARRAALQAL